VPLSLGPVLPTLMDVHPLRPISAEDKDRLTRFHSRLSEESRYRRYHGAKGPLTRRELVYLTEVDQRDHVAVVADCGDGEIGAVARIVSNGDGTAEVAVVVADDCRGQGFGAQVVEAAVRHYDAHGPGDELLAHVQTENRAAMHLFVDRLGGRPVRYDEGVALVRLPDSD
jgi:ribosomal protein S18 acetylase RimI-like enzyme